MLKSWKTTLLGVVLMAVGSYHAFVGGNEAITALFITNSLGLLIAKDYDA